MKRRRQSLVFFPWERRRGVFGAIGRARSRVVLGIAIVVALVVWIRGREERAAGIRATRASITTMERAVASYRADHAGACPRELTDLVTGGYARDISVDAWGRPLRLACSGRGNSQEFE